MPYFTDTKKQFLIACSYKVMYSWLFKQSSLSEIQATDIFRLLFYNKIKRIHSILLVRDPFSRLESFFKDKFRKDIHSKKEIDKPEWQHCQQIFFDVLGIGKDTADDKKIAAFMSFQYADFVEALPLLYFKDGHLIPQHNIETITWRRLRFKLKMDHIIHIENDPEKRILKEVAGLSDINIRENDTQDIDLEVRYSPKMIDIVSDIYAKDFLFYNYPNFTAK